MCIRFITSRLLRVIVCAAAGRFDFQGYYMMAAMHAGICLLLGVLVWLFLKGTKKLREKIAVG